MTKFYHGQVVFDKKRSDPTDDLLVVVNPTVGTWQDLDDETAEYVWETDVNHRFGLTEETPMVEVAYVSAGPSDVTIGEKTYTFPVTRLQTVTSTPNSALDGCYPYQWALAGFFAELVAATTTRETSIDVEQLQVLCMAASVEGAVITRGTDWGDSGRTPRLDYNADDD